MRTLVAAANAAVGIENDRIVPSSGHFDAVFSIPDAELRPGLINAHEHLHRNHYGRLGAPPYINGFEWGRDIHTRYSDAIALGRAVPRRQALLRGAWKNIVAGVTTVVHHDAWEEAFDDDFPLRVAQVRNAHSLRHGTGLAAAAPTDATTAGVGPFAIHLAEGVDFAAAEEIRQLERQGLLNKDLLAVHCVGPDTDGVRRLRESGAAVVWCPTSNAFLFGRTASSELLEQGVDVLLGSDSLLSGLGTLLEELRFARRLGVVSDDRLLDAVGAVAAARLGLPEPTLDCGARADLAVFRQPVLQARVDDVALVIVAGVPRVVHPELAAGLGPWREWSELRQLRGVIRWVIDTSPTEAVGDPTTRLCADR